MRGARPRPPGDVSIDLVDRFGLARAARVFIPLWLLAAAVNMWVGVSKAGYSVAEEAPTFVVVFAVPAAVACLVLWKLAQG